MKDTAIDTCSVCGWPRRTVGGCVRCAVVQAATAKEKPKAKEFEYVATTYPPHVPETDKWSSLRMFGVGE